MNGRSFHNIWWGGLLRGSGHMKGYQRIFEQKLNQKILYIFECLSISGFKLIRNTFSIYKTLYLKWLKSTTLINQSVEKCRRWCDEGKSILWPMVSHNLTVQCQCGLERIKKEYESYYMTQFVSIEGVSSQWSIRLNSAWYLDVWRRQSFRKRTRFITISILLYARSCATASFKNHGANL